MKKTKLALLAVAASLCALATATQANQIVGVYAMSGTAVMNAASVDTATEVVSWSGVSVSGASSGDFAAAIGDSVSLATPWIFANLPVDPLWTAGNFSFDLTGITSIVQGSGSLQIKGTGWVNDPTDGKDSTAGTWDFTSQDPGTLNKKTGNATFSFSASGAVPDGGLTVAMLGGGMVLLGGLRRKLS